MNEMTLIMYAGLYIKNAGLIYTTQGYYPFWKPVNPCIHQALAVCSPVVRICVSLHSLPNNV